MTDHKRPVLKIEHQVSISQKISVLQDSLSWWERSLLLEMLLQKNNNV